MSIFRRFALHASRILAVNGTSAVNKTDIKTIKRWVAPTLRELQRRKEKEEEVPQPRSTYLEWNYDAELFAFGKRLGENFDRTVLRKALTHRSYVVQQEIKLQEQGVETGGNSDELQKNSDNSQLIKLGEEIISHYVSVKFQDKYPSVVVKSVLNYLTSDSMLSFIASHIGLKDIVLCADFPVENRTLANSLKAIVAAVEESSGTERAELFVNDFLLPQLNGKDLFELWDPKEPYSYLKNLLKEKGISDAEPRLCNSSAMNTILACYQVGLYCDKKLIGSGFGESVDLAKESAAFDAIRNIYMDKVML